MVDDPRNLQWVSINDFTPGVADRVYQAAGTLGPWATGTATVEDTYRCRALPNGALGPLPRRTDSFAVPMPSGIEPATPVLFTGFLIQGRINGTTPDGYDDANWIVGASYLKASPGPNEGQQIRIWRFQMWDDPPSRDTIETYQDDSPYYLPVYLESSRSAASGSPTDVGVPLVVYTIRNGNFLGLPGETAGTWGMFPDPGDSDQLVPHVISTDYGPGPMVVYQGRSLICNWQDFFNGSVSIVWRTNENIFYTNSNQPDLATALASTFTPEDPGEIMALCVSSANELFVLKHRQGAFVIRGDITFPTVLRVPGIQGAGNTSQVPIASPIGVIYQSRGSGIYSWPGGEQSQLLSPQLEPENFYYNGVLGAEDLSFLPASGGYAFYEDLIFCPPKWAYSYLTKSWWPLDDIENDDAIANGFLWFQRSLVPRSLIAVRGEQYDGEDYAFAYDFSLGAKSYRWTSQPIAATLDTFCEIRELVLRATGVDDSTVTITFLSNGVSTAYKFTLSGSTYPRVLRKDVAVVGGDIQVRIDANSHDADEPAPIVFDVKFGYYEKNSLPQEPTTV